MSYMSPAARTGYNWHMDYYWQGKVITGAWTYSWHMDPQIRHSAFLGNTPFYISLCSSYNNPINGFFFIRIRQNYANKDVKSVSPELVLSKVKLVT